MRVRLYKMRLEGWVAVGNLLLVGLALGTFLVAFPDLTVNVDTASPRMLALDSAINVALAILTFPVGWLSDLFRLGVSGPPITAVIFVPLNAYLWGYVAAALIKWGRARKARHRGAADSAVRP